MQTMAQNTTTSDDITSTQWAITGELAAIIVLVIATVLLRLFSLGEVTLGDSEAQQALSAWRAASPQAPGTAILSESPVLFWGQRVTFTLLGGGEVPARLATALAGVLLSLSPLLFRKLFGRARAYLFALLLTFSPVLLGASRFSSGAVWAMLFAVLGLWALWRYWGESRHDLYGVLGIVAFMACLFLTEPAGILLVLVLLCAGGVAVAAALFVPADHDLPGDDFIVSVYRRFKGLPWMTGSLLSGLIVVAVSTGFMLYPGGLGMISALLDGFIDGWRNVAPGYPRFFPLAVSLFYESWLWILAGVALVVFHYRTRWTLVDCFLVSWLVVGSIAAILYPGARAAHGLWLTVPLAGLASSLFAWALEGDEDEAWFGLSFEGDQVNGQVAKWVLALSAFILLSIAALQVQVISRFFLNVPDGSLMEFFNRLRVPLPRPSPAMSLIWLMICLMFATVGGFLVSSVWGGYITRKAAVLGAFAFALVVFLANGWNLAVARADDPAELWHVRPFTQDARLLRETLQDFAFRETGGMPLITVTVLDDDDGAVAWLLRDFVNAQFVDTLRDTQTEPVILMAAPADAADSEMMPDLGGSYVGHRFVLSREWSIRSMQGMDFLPWWVLRKTRFAAQPADIWVLWVRQDIYDGEPFSTSELR